MYISSSSYVALLRPPVTSHKAAAASYLGLPVGIYLNASSSPAVVCFNGTPAARAKLRNRAIETGSLQRFADTHASFVGLKLLIYGYNLSLGSTTKSPGAAQRASGN